MELIVIFKLKNYFKSGLFCFGMRKIENIIKYLMKNAVVQYFATEDSTQFIKGSIIKLHTCKFWQK